MCDKECVDGCIACYTGDTWYHAECVNMSAKKKLEELVDETWYCQDCSGTSN